MKSIVTKGAVQSQFGMQNIEGIIIISEEKIIPLVGP